MHSAQYGADQAGIPIQVELHARGFTRHGGLPHEFRMLPGNLDSSIFRRRRSGCLQVPGNSNSSGRTCTLFQACRTARTTQWFSYLFLARAARTDVRSTFTLNIPQLWDEACSLPKTAQNSARKNPKNTIGHPRAPEQAASFALRNIFVVAGDC